MQKHLSLKKLGALLLATLLLLSIASCKKKEEQTDGESTASGTNALAEPLPAPTLAELQAKIQEAQETNPLVYGWLVVPGTTISEPVVFDQINDNAYWESRNLAGEVVDNSKGEIKDTVVYASFLDKFADKSSDDAPNNVLFGHNWNNINPPYVIGPDPEFKMFGQLPSFTDADFAAKHQYIYFATEDTMRVYKVFSAMHCEKDWRADLGFNYIDVEPSTENFSVMLEEMKDRSDLDFATEVGTTDRILTLSTCSRYLAGGGADQRYVVVGRLLREGEAENDLAEVSVNEDKKQPKYD